MEAVRDGIEEARRLAAEGTEETEVQQERRGPLSNLSGRQL